MVISLILLDPLKNKPGNWARFVCLLWRYSGNGVY